MNVESQSVGCLGVGLLPSEDRIESSFETAASDRFENLRDLLVEKPILHFSYPLKFKGLDTNSMKWQF